MTATAVIAADVTATMATPSVSMSRNPYGTGAVSVVVIWNVGSNTSARINV